MQIQAQRSLRLAPLVLAVLLTAPLPAWSAAGKVLFVTGEVLVSSPSRPLSKLPRGAAINPGDSIKTGINGFTQIVMEDGGRITLRANSQLQINEFKFEDKSSGLSLMSLLKGSMRAVTGLIGHNNRNNYKIKTPTATIGIRGSDGNIGYSPELGSAVQTIEGGHTLTYVEPNGTAHTLDLNPGEVGLLPPDATNPIKVKNFPFPTTQPPIAPSNSNKLSNGLQRDITGPKSALDGKNVDLEGSNRSPGLQDSSGGVIGINSDGMPEVLTPLPNVRGQ